MQIKLIDIVNKSISNITKPAYTAVVTVEYVNDREWGASV